MSSREAFEKDAENNEYLSLDRDPSGQYRDRETQIAWESWKTATERAATICDSQHDHALTSSGAHRADCCAVRIRQGNN